MAYTGQVRVYAYNVYVAWASKHVLTVTLGKQPKEAARSAYGQGSMVLHNEKFNSVKRYINHTQKLGKKA